MKFLTIILIVYVLSACSDNKTNDTATKEIFKDSALFETQTDASEKAKAVEQSLQDNVNKRDEEMREQGI